MMYAVLARCNALLFLSFRQPPPWLPPSPSGEGHPPLAVRSQSARRKPCTGEPRVALHCRGACRTNYARLRRADLIRHGAAQKRSTVPPSPRGRLSAAAARRRRHRQTNTKNACRSRGRRFILRLRSLIPFSASDNGGGGGACDTCVCYRRGCTAQAR